MNNSFNDSTVTLVYSILENGHRVEYLMPIGSTYETEWGPRKVVSNGRETISTTETEPFGV